MLKENTYLSFLGLLLGSIKRLYLNPTKPILYDYPTWLNTILESNYETKQNKKQTHYQNLSSDKRFSLLIRHSKPNDEIHFKGFPISSSNFEKMEKDLILIFHLFDLLPMTYSLIHRTNDPFGWFLFFYEDWLSRHWDLTWDLKIIRDQGWVTQLI